LREKTRSDSIRL